MSIMSVLVSVSVLTRGWPANKGLTRLVTTIDPTKYFQIVLTLGYSCKFA